MATDAGPRWLEPPEQAVWRRLLAVQARLTARLDDDLRANTDIGLADYDVLVVLAESDGCALRMRELAERVLLSRSGLTRRVDRLVALGLVERETCPTDRRGAIATLTDRGRACMEEAAPTHVAGVRRHLFDSVGPAALPGLERALGAMADSLDAESSAARQPGSGPSTTGRPLAYQPLVPPATDTAG